MRKSIFLCVGLLYLFGTTVNAQADNASPLVVEKITGPWLWTVIPVEGEGGAAATDIDSIAMATGGAITEAQIAEVGAEEGAGDLTWALAVLNDEDDNVNKALMSAGLVEGPISNATAYALITIKSEIAQSNVTMRVGSDDSIKVWLNGQVVHKNAVNRASIGFQDEFLVKLEAGDNFLMAKVSNGERGCVMHVGCGADFLAGGLLFSVGLEHQADLDNGNISAELRQEFEERGYTLSQNATVLVQKQGSEWRINDDNNRIYIIRREDDRLNIYGDGKEYKQVEVGYTVGPEGALEDDMPRENPIAGVPEKIYVGLETEIPCPEPGSLPWQGMSSEAPLTFGPLISIEGNSHYRFLLSYRSQINFAHSRFGANCDHNYSMRLVENGDELILYTADPYPRLDNFVLVNSAPRTWQDKTGVFAKIVQAEYDLVNQGGVLTTQDYLIFRNRHGERILFYPFDGLNPGRLAAIVSPLGHIMLFFYENGFLTTVRETMGRDITYTYNAEGRLVKVTDSIGRTLEFGYDAEGNLIYIGLPEITGTSTGNDFFGNDRKAFRFTYTSGFANPTLNHNLTTITFPNEVESGGPPRLIFEYNDKDELIAYTWGGTNASGVPAGGRISLTHEDLPGGDPDDLTSPVKQTTMVDRNGNRTVFLINSNGHIIEKREETRGLRPGDPAAYVTSYGYNADGLLTKITLPEGNYMVYEYDTPNPDRFAQRNLLSETRFPDAIRGGDQDSLRRTYEYDPFFNNVIAVTEERSHDPDHIPPNGGANSLTRYRTEYTPDYFEDPANARNGNHELLADVAVLYGIDLSGLTPLGDVNGDGVLQGNGNIIRTRYPDVQLLSTSPQVAVEGGTTQVSETLTQFNDMGKVIRSEDAACQCPGGEGEVTIYRYFPQSDPDGDGQDLLTGNNNRGDPLSPDSGGYLRERVQASPSTEITTSYTRNPVGVMTSETDGRGIRTDYEVNSHDQVVQTTRAADVSAALANPAEENSNLVAYGYRTRTFYDANGNVARREIENRDSNTPGVGAFVEYTSTYDILDNVVEETEEVSATEILITRFRYDANENQTLVESPLAVAGVEPYNQVKTAYDERGLVLSKTRGADGPHASTTTYDYDGNGNLVVTTDAEDNDGDGSKDRILMIYDRFDRLVEVISRVGTVTRRTYDAASNVVVREVFGTIGGASPAGNDTSRNVLLSRSHHFFDERSREYQTDQELFVSAGVSPVRSPVLEDGDLSPGDMRVSSFRHFGRDNRIASAETASREGAREITRYEHDDLGRLVRIIDPEGNEVLIVYDHNNNPIRLIQIDRNPTGLVPDETFTTINVYDALNRLERTTDNVGQTRRFGYDSRDNLTVKTDAQRPPVADPLGLFSGQINGPGNSTETFYNGVNRVTAVVQDLRTDGEGGNPIDTSNPANPDGQITILTEWDRNSRVKSRTDDNGNRTEYFYNDRNLPVRVRYADGTENRYEYNLDDEVDTFTDGNGSVHTTTYDGANRLLSVVIDRAAGVGGTTLQSFQYDGMDRLTRSTDNNDPTDPADDSEVLKVYDSLSRLLEELQNGQVISSQWTADDDRVACIYPNGTRIGTTLDRLDRTVGITFSGADVCRYDYIGPRRVLERTYANGTRLTYLNEARNADVGYDGIRRIVRQRHERFGGPLLDTEIVTLDYTYNRENNILSERTRFNAQDVLDEVTYDSIYRVTDFRQNAGNAGSIPVTTQDWTLDGVHNWAETMQNGVMKTQVVNEMNEYVSFAGMPTPHDDNGNQLSDGTHDFTWDAFNRLIEVHDTATGDTVARYAYHTDNRRFQKMVSGLTIQYFYDGWRVVEERDERDRVLHQYVDGNGIDEHILMIEYPGGSDDPRRGRYFFYHEDHRPMNVVALTDKIGEVADRMRYTAYGEVMFLNEAGEGKSQAEVLGNPYLFNSRRFDGVVGLYYYRARYLDIRMGRFTARDMLGIWGDPRNLGNSYSYVGDNPLTNIDPTGTQGGSGIAWLKSKLKLGLKVFRPKAYDVAEFIVKKVLTNYDYGCIPGTFRTKTDTAKCKKVCVRYSKCKGKYDQKPVFGKGKITFQEKCKALPVLGKIPTLDWQFWELNKVISVGTPCDAKCPTGWKDMGPNPPWTTWDTTGIL